MIQKLLDLAGRRRPDMYQSDADRVLSHSEKLAAVTSALSSLEMIINPSLFNDDGIFAWRVSRLWMPQRDAKLIKALAPLLEYPWFLLIPYINVAAAARLLLGRPGTKERALLLGTMFGAKAALSVRHRQGGDGSDQVSGITILTALLAKTMPNDERVQEACVRLIAYQSCLAYAASGIVKMTSPTWRSGRSIKGVLRTEAFGDQWLYQNVIKRHPAIPFIISWSVMLGEVAFPLVLIAPRSIAKSILAITTSFHLANARFMGLPRFVWAFASTYPAISHVAKELEA